MSSKSYRIEIGSSVFAKIMGLIFILLAFYIISIAQGGFMIAFMISFLSITLGIFMIFHKTVKEYDFEKMMMRNGIFLFGKTRSIWNKLPQSIKYISIVQVKMRGKHSAGFLAEIPDTQTIYKELQINLIDENNKRTVVDTSNSVEDAISKAKEIAKFLNTKIYVATSEKKYWIEIEKMN